MDPRLNNQVFVDSHCHLPLLKEPLENTLVKCQELRVGLILNVGYDRESSENSVRLTNHVGISAAIGVHPHYATGNLLANMEWLEQLAENQKVVSIGEIGLDNVKSLTSKTNQIEWFEAQLFVAQKKSLPVVIHNRSADKDIEAILSRFPSLSVVLHCFSSDVDFGTRMIENGYYLSFSGNITYSKSDELRKMLAKIPLQQLLLETDAPYLTPQPYRGKQENSPVMMPFIYSYAAEVRMDDLDTMSEQIRLNYQTLFFKKIKEIKTW